MSETSIKEALLAIADLNGGRLTPEDVLQAAEHPDHPAHNCFTWDDSEAARLQRLHEARRLIRGVRIDIRTEYITIKAPMFVRNPELDASVQGYATLGRLRSDEDMARDAIVSEFKRASAHLSRAHAIAVALGMADEIDQLRYGVDELISRAQQEEGPRAAS